MKIQIIRSALSSWYRWGWCGNSYFKEPEHFRPVLLKCTGMSESPGDVLQVVLELQAVRLQLGLEWAMLSQPLLGLMLLVPGYHSEIYCFKCHGEN